MKFLLYACIFLVAVAAQCSKSTAPAATASTTTSATPATDDGSVAASTTTNAQPIDISHVPKASASKTAYLATGVWHMTATSKPNATSTPLAVTDVQFLTDGLAVLLNNGERVGTGKWAFDDANSIVYVSSTIADLNSSWKVRDKGFRMIWLGNTDINTSGLQIRWDCYK